MLFMLSPTWQPSDKTRPSDKPKASGKTKASRKTEPSNMAEVDDEPSHEITARRRAVQSMYDEECKAWALIIQQRVEALDTAAESPAMRRSLALALDISSCSPPQLEGCTGELQQQAGRPTLLEDLVKKVKGVMQSRQMPMPGADKPVVRHGAADATGIERLARALFSHDDR
jgi:hypothetical protein